MPHQLLPEPNPIPVPRKGHGKGLHNLPKRLQDLELVTPEEAEKLTPRMARRLVEVWNQQPSVEDLASVAQLGRADRQWYHKAAIALNALFDDDAPRVAALLGATSPGAGPTDNLHKALRVWVSYQQWLLKRTRQGVKGLPSYEEVLQQVPTWADPRDSHNPNVARALSSPNPAAQFVLSGPKVGSFHHNVFQPNFQGALARVTADRWHARLHNIPEDDLGRWLPSYLSTVAKTRQTTRVLQQKYPKEAQFWTPPGTQAAQWMATRTLAGIIGRARLPANANVNPHPVNRVLGHGPMSPKRALQELTHEDIAGGANFHNPLLEDPRVAEILEPLFGKHGTTAALGRVQSAVSKAPVDPAESLKGPVLDKTLKPADRAAALRLAQEMDKYRTSFGHPHPMIHQATQLKRKARPTRLSRRVHDLLAATLSKSYNDTGSKRRVGMKTRRRLAKVEPTPEPTSPLAGPQGPRFDPVDQSYASFSPNTEEDLSFEDAYTRSQSSNQQQFRKITDHVLKQLGMKGKSYDAIGDWIDGAENSVMQEISDPSDPETLKYASAWYGLLGNQKAVLTFHSLRDGPDSVYSLEVPQSDVNKVREQLTSSGVPFRTIVPNKQGVRVVVYDEKRNLRDKVAKFASHYNASIREALGRGEFIGGVTRSAARREYRRIIDAYERTHSRRPSPPTGPGQIRPVGTPTGDDYLGSAASEPKKAAG